LVIILTGHQTCLHSRSHARPSDCLLTYTYLVRDEVRVGDIIQLLESELDVYFLKSLAATVLSHLARKDAYIVDDILGKYLKRLLNLIVQDIFIRNFRAQVLYAHG
jgi:hypothetical protein